MTGVLCVGIVGGTFNGHPAMAAARAATIDKMLNEPMDRLNSHSVTESRPERVMGDVVDLLQTSRKPC